MKLLLEWIRASLNEPEQGLVLRALRHDPIVWESLQEVSVLGTLSGVKRDACELWMAGSLAISLIQPTVHATGISALQRLAGDESIVREGVTLLGWVEKGHAPSNLREAGLVALELWRRAQETSWENILPHEQFETDPERWNAPLVCLWGYLDDPHALLEFLAALPEPLSYHHVLHVLLSQPLSDQEQWEYLRPVILRQSLSQQVQWPWYLLQEGRKELAGLTASHVLVLSRRALEAWCDQDISNLTTWSDLKERAFWLHATALLFRLSGMPARSLERLEQLQALLDYWKAGVAIQQMALYPSGSLGQEASTKFPGLILEQFSVWGLGDALALSGQELGEWDINTPPILLEVLKWARKSETIPDAQRQILVERLRSWLEDQDAAHLQRVMAWLGKVDPKPLLRALQRLGLSELGIEVGQRVLEYLSPSEDLFLQMCDLCDEAGFYQQALIYGLQGVIHFPQSIPIRRKLARAYERLEAWEKALEEWRHLTGDETLEDKINDRMSLIYCAIQVGRFQEAFEECQRVLNDSPENGMAYAYLGVILLENGEMEEAVQALTQATLLCPTEAYPWVKLAEYYQRHGEVTKAIDTLRSASLVLPTSAEIHLALGKILLERGNLSEALPYLRRASDLTPNSYEANLLLIQTLLGLGYHEESQAVLMRAGAHWPDDPHLIFLKACLQQRLGAEAHQVRETMRSLLDHGDVRPEWAWFYLKTLWNKDEDLLNLGAHALPEELEQAQALLRRLLVQQPDNQNAQLLMGCVLLARGQSEVALSIFQTLESDRKSLEYCKQAVLLGGIGMSALKQHQPEVALAALEEAIALCPEWPRLHMALAEVYASLNLKAAAQETANRLLDHFADDLEVVEWFVQFANQEQWIEEKIKGLEQATALVPQCGTYWLRLADALAEGGEEERALEILTTLSSQPHLDATVVSMLSQRLYARNNYLLAAHSLCRLKGEAEFWNKERSLQVALLSFLAGELETARAALLETLEMAPDWLPARVVQAYWLTREGRASEAVAVLEAILQQRLDDPLFEDSDIKDWTHDLLQKGGIDFSRGAVHFLYARLKLRLGDIETAYVHFVRAATLCPQALAYRGWAVLAAQATLRFTEVRALIEVEPATFEAIQLGDAERNWRALMMLLAGELALEEGDLEGVYQRIEQSLAWRADFPRAIALKVRYLATLGRWREARALYERLGPVIQAALLGVFEEHEVGMEWGWLGEAALAVLDWERGLQLLQSNAERFSGMPIAHWRLARAWVVTQMACTWADVLGIQDHRPPEIPDVLKRFEEALAKLKDCSQEALVEQLRVWGYGVFAPTYSNVRALVGLPLNSERAAALLVALVHLQNWPGAEKVAEQFMQDVWMQFYAATFLGTRAPEKGMMWALKALEELSDFPPLFVALARCARAASNLEVALEAMDRALNLWPSEWRWLEEAASLAMETENPSRAVDFLERLLQECPNHLAAHLNLARLYVDLNQGVLARGHLEQALLLAPENPEVVLQYLQTLWVLGEAQKVVEIAKSYLDKFSDRSTLLKVAARAAIETGSWEYANTWTQTLIEKGEDDPESVLLRVAYLERREDKRKALAYLDRVIESRDENVALLGEKAHLISQLDGYAQALPIIQKVLTQDPENSAMLGLAAQAFWSLGDITQAEAMALKGLQNMPDQENLHMLMGQICSQKGQLDKALYHFGEALRLNPQNLEGYLAMAKVYQLRRESPKAFEIYQQALRIAPRDPRVYYEYGLALRDGKDYLAAESMLRRAAQLAPDNLAIKRQLGALVALNLVHQPQEA
ncbi:tetratricopeptide repeat protein [uncultured Thermanaerothrix sp.]|uniref:tetratricopeptide repeat protein n=1 Tax=uncultured Thermanaerothrix sp. TaxID=1195149 RepID=UPI00261EE892|nr:tetratricopeptide repeat protein [uncultured Thermanaerothrix sp.]